MKKRNRNDEYSFQVNDAVGNKKREVTTTKNDNKSKDMMERMVQLEDNALLISLANERLLKENQILKTNNFQLKQEKIYLNNRMNTMQSTIEMLKTQKNLYAVQIGKLKQEIGTLHNGSGHNTGSSGMEVDDYKKIIKW